MGRVIAAAGEATVTAVTDLCREAISDILYMQGSDSPPADVQLCAYFARPDLIVPICFAAWTGTDLVHVAPTTTAEILLSARASGVFTTVARGDYSVLLLLRSLVVEGVSYRYLTDRGDEFEATVRDEAGVVDLFETTELVHAQLRLDQQYRRDGL